jgi:hypothetical protein
VRENTDTEEIYKTKDKIIWRKCGKKKRKITNSAMLSNKSSDNFYDKYILELYSRKKKFKRGNHTDQLKFQREKEERW